MHELWLVKGATMTDITPMLGGLSWKSSTDTLGDELSFEIAFNDTRFFPINPCDVGDMVVLKNGEEITRAVIVDEDRSGRGPISYTAYDFAFYLNKSSSVYQFNGMSASGVLKKVLSDFGVPIGGINVPGVAITKIYNNVVVSDIIRDVLDILTEKTGKIFLMEMRQGKMYIENQTTQTVSGTFQLADNVEVYDVTDAIGDISHKRSITDMINSVQIVGNDDKLLLTKSDGAMVSKYGKLQKVVTLDQDEKLSAAQVAQNELNVLSKMTEEISVELIGDDRVRAGRLFKLSEPVTGVSGTFLITDATHTIANGIHTMSLTLGVA